eukprot:tig00021168_g19103.t1
MQYGLAYPLPSLASARADPYSSADSSRSSFAFGGRGDSPSLLQHQQTQQQQQQQQQLQRSPVLPSGVPLTHSLASTGMSSHMMHALPPPLPSPPPPPPPQQQQLPPTSSASFVPLPAPLAQQQRQQPLTQASISSQTCPGRPPSASSEPPAQQKPGAAPVRADTQQQGYKHAAHAGTARAARRDVRAAPAPGRHRARADRPRRSAEDPAAAAPKSAATLQAPFTPPPPNSGLPRKLQGAVPPTSWDAFAAYPISEIPRVHVRVGANVLLHVGGAAPSGCDGVPAPQTQFQAYSRPTGAPAPPLPGASQVKVEAARAGGRAGEAAPPPRQRAGRAPPRPAPTCTRRAAALPRGPRQAAREEPVAAAARRRSRPYPPCAARRAGGSLGRPGSATAAPPPPGSPAAPRGPAAAAGTQLPPGAGPARTPATTRGAPREGRGRGAAGPPPPGGAQPLAPPLPALALKVPSRRRRPAAVPAEARARHGLRPALARDDFPFAYGPSEAAPVAYEPIPKTELVDNSWRPPPPPRPLHT